jgi:hypothetical protein
MEDIINWLTSDMNYTEGINIFAKYCKNKAHIRILKNGNYHKKLEYELKKMLGIKTHIITSQTGSNQQLINQCYKPVKKIPKKAKSKKEQNKIPDIIADAKEIRKDLRTKIALMHNQLYELGESNDKKIVAKRKKILDERKPIIDRYETIYQLIEEYFITKIVPQELIAELKNNTTIIVEDKTTDYNALTDMQLIIAKNRLASRITKQKNILNYQSNTAKEEQNPMPEGPKKVEATEKLNKLTGEYKKVIELIKNRNNAI